MTLWVDSQLSLYTDNVALKGTERRSGKWSHISTEKTWDLKIFLPHLVILHVKKLSYKEANYLAKVTQLLKHLQALE